MNRPGSIKDLFGDTPYAPAPQPPTYPQAAGFKEQTTSRAAADAIAPEIGERQAEVLKAYQAAGPRGLTADEAAEKVDRSVLAVRPRVTELGVMDLIERSGERRANASGMNAAVWRIKA